MGAQGGYHAAARDDYARLAANLAVMPTGGDPLAHVLEGWVRKS
jgi:hypothetical protein